MSDMAFLPSDRPLDVASSRPKSGSSAILLQQMFVLAASRISEEVSANFRAWYERNFVNPRAGRIGVVSYLRAGELDEQPGDCRWYADSYERALVDHTESLRPDEFAFILQNPLVALQLVVGVTDLRGLRCFRRGLTQGVNRLQAKAYRSRYYAHDNERRRRLAAERRRIRRRRTLNPCPTPEAFRAAFARRAESIDARIHFGGLVHDLECYVDNCLRFDDNGEIVGRNGGVKAWIATHVPELHGHYKTIMRYKALAKRVRQVAGIKDPVPTDVLLPLVETISNPSAGEASRLRAGDIGCLVGEISVSEQGARKDVHGVENYYAQKSHSAGIQRDGDGSKDVCVAVVGDLGMKVRPDKNYYAVESHRAQEPHHARKRVGCVLLGCSNTLKELFMRLD